MRNMRQILEDELLNILLNVAGIISIMLFTVAVLGQHFVSALLLFVVGTIFIFLDDIVEEHIKRLLS